jgi:hypothetical protein
MGFVGFFTHPPPPPFVNHGPDVCLLKFPLRDYEKKIFLSCLHSSGYGNLARYIVKRGCVYVCMCIICIYIFLTEIQFKGGWGMEQGKRLPDNQMLIYDCGDPSSPPSL